VAWSAPHLDSSPNPPLLRRRLNVAAWQRARFQRPSYTQFASGLSASGQQQRAGGIRVEVTPTADTCSEAGGPFYFYLQVYDPQAVGTAPSKAVLHLRILDTKTGKIVKQLDPESAAAYATSGNPLIPIGGGIDITKLPKDSYELQAQATDSNGSSTPWSSVGFTLD
jgi:hypothetical protein